MSQLADGGWRLASPERVETLHGSFALHAALDGSGREVAWALTRGDVAHAVSMLVESETRGVAASRPRSRAGSPRPQ